MKGIYAERARIAEGVSCWYWDADEGSCCSKSFPIGHKNYPRPCYCWKMAARTLRQPHRRDELITKYNRCKLPRKLEK